MLINKDVILIPKLLKNIPIILIEFLEPDLPPSLIKENQDILPTLSNSLKD
jgi:hypothetical protein